MLTLYEYYRITEALDFNPDKILGILTGSILFVLTFIISAFDKPIKLLALLIPLMVLIFIIELYRKKPNPLVNISITFLGIFYITVPVSLFNYFGFYNSGQYDYHIILGFFILLWTNDTAAYLSGLLLGRHRLFERISPKKSWEGFIGGTLITLIIAFFLHLFLSDLARIDWIIIGIIISIAGVYGDLVESMFKRSADIKDSGAILPGHGGMLDRFDSVFLSSGLVFLYLLIIKSIIVL